MHAFDQFITLFTDTPFVLENGRSLSSVSVCYQTYGVLNSDKSNAILLCHALTGSAHAAFENESGEKGWWFDYIGPNKAIDTNRFFVICTNSLGSCYGTTGPDSINPDTQQKYGTDFPIITISDMVHLQFTLIQHFGIPSLFAVIGGSMGGMQALKWSLLYPNHVQHCVPIATTATVSPQVIAFDAVGRHAIVSDSNWEKGFYGSDSSPKEGLTVARMIGHITYLSNESMKSKFGRNLQKKDTYDYTFDVEFQIESYLKYQGDKFVSRFDPNTYLYLTKAISYFDLTHQNISLEQSFRDVSSRFLLISIKSDWLYPPQQMKEIVKALMRTNKNVSYIELNSDNGHDAFLMPNDQLSDTLNHFLENR